MKIQKGSIFRTKNAGDFFGAINIIIDKVENPESLDGFAYFSTRERMHNRKHHKCRIWWLKDFCFQVK